MQRWAKLAAAGLALALARRAWRAVRHALHTSEHVFQDACITPQPVQDEMRRILQCFQAAADRQGLTWWLDYGTLLGAWRLGDLMAFDHDGDVGYLAEERERLERCVAELAGQGIELNVERGGLFCDGRKLCDVDPWHRHRELLVRSLPESRREGWILDQLEARYNDFPAAWIEPRWRIRFLGRMFPCPNHPERRLRQAYPTARLHLRLCFPHRQRCWICPDFYREAWRIWRTREYPVLEPGG